MGVCQRHYWGAAQVPRVVVHEERERRGCGLDRHPGTLGDPGVVKRTDRKRIVGTKRGNGSGQASDGNVASSTAGRGCHLDLNNSQFANNRIASQVDDRGTDATLIWPWR